MSKEFKLVPRTATLEMKAAGKAELERQDIPPAEMQTLWFAMSNAAPQPPALGGEPETLAVVTLGYFSSEELGDIDIEPQMSVLERIQQELVRSDSDEHLELIDRAHLDKSQLEVERLKSEAEENHKEREVICSNYDQLKARCDELEHRATDVVEGLDGEELPGAMTMRIRKLKAALSKPAGSEQVSCNNEREHLGVSLNTPCKACGRGPCIDR
ncbi:hypothetical protein [Pseudomonas viridiflava]|uniref:hypothetical protein n=1 Tax=Pseudomonas viridiflava TaxID=33069 RepID=UPI002EB5A505|nr:hypothetical protein [Pseudomonas viridiflava]